MTSAIHRLALAAAAVCSMAIGGCGNAQTPGMGDTGTAPSAPGAGPDLSSCAPVQAGPDWEISRKGPLELPPALAGIAASDFDHIAFVTLGAATLCIDTSWMDGASDMALSPDGGFVTFKWYGFEDYGAKLVDLRGEGSLVETGETPVRSPSGRLVAAVEYSESGFGSLNALGLWDIASSPVREVAIIQFPEGYTDWRFDGWASDQCLWVSATTFERLGDDGLGPDEAARDGFVSKEARGWQVEPAGERGCAAP